jgi:hypothetical protein
MVVDLAEAVTDQGPKDNFGPNTGYIMDAIIDCLKNIEKHLANIERVIAKPKLGELLVKGAYSVEELAELTQTHGVKSYRPFTVRLACKDARIPEAAKLEGGKWVIPREAVLRILQEGLPPERRVQKRSFSMSD